MSSEDLGSTVKDAGKQTYQSELYQAAGAAMMSFQPISGIKQHLCAFHSYAHDPNRHVQAHHLCSHLHAQNMHQCIIYDSNDPGARVIGIEYVIPEDKFISLPEEEKKYWHSHKFEVESGLLMLIGKSMVPNMVMNQAEIPAMMELHDTYGKTIHTWQYDIHPDLPLGPPTLMMSYTSDEQVPKDLVKKRDEELGVDTAATRAHRQTYFPQEMLDKMPLKGADQITSGQSWQFELVQKEVPVPKDIGVSSVKGRTEL